MAAISGREFGLKLIKALGLQGRGVRDLVITVPLDDVVTVRFRQFVHQRQGVVVEVEEVTRREDAEQLANALNGAVDLLGGEWRETFVERDGVLTLDGPAERLAVAVLNGDVESALVLADLVQEIWTARAGVEAVATSGE